jgi:hypothetical protein
MMSTQEVAKCADRLQYLYEVLYGSRIAQGRRFPDIEADLSMVLGWLIPELFTRLFSPGDQARSL